METALARAGGGCQCDGRSAAHYLAWPGTAVPGGVVFQSQPEWFAVNRRATGDAGWAGFGRVEPADVRFRGWVRALLRAIEAALDVVACNWRHRNWCGRILFSARAGCGVRQH